MTEKNDITYQYCGIEDAGLFYQQRDHSSLVPEFSAFTSDPELAISLTWAKHMWIAKAVYNHYHRLKRPLNILEYGCGYGSIGFLKQMIPCTLVGIDYNQSARKAVMDRGYDDYIIGDFINESFDQHAPFDIICSLDVYGHIEFRDKDRVLEKMSALLQADGVMIEGVETGCFDYFASREKAIEFARVDGHVGIELFEEVKSRYQQFFPYIYGQHRFSVNVDSHQIEKACFGYGDTTFSDWAPAIAKFLPEERRLFDLGQGIMFDKLTRTWSETYEPHGGFGFIIASRSPLSDPLAQPIEGIAPIEVEDLYLQMNRSQQLAFEASYGFSRFWARARGFEIPEARAFGFQSDVPEQQISRYLEQKSSEAPVARNPGKLSRWYHGLMRRLGLNH